MSGNDEIRAEVERLAAVAVAAGRPVWQVQMPQGHATACLDNGCELIVIDLGGTMEWQVCRPTDRSHGFLTGGNIEVADSGRVEARLAAMRAAERGCEIWLAMLAEGEEALGG